MTALAGLTLLMSGGSRVIGLAVATRSARGGVKNLLGGAEALAGEAVADLDGCRAVPGYGRPEPDLFLEPVESDA